MLVRFSRSAIFLLTVRLAVVAGAIIAGVGPVLLAQQARSINAGIYSDTQAKRGQVIFHEKCAQCHGEALGGGLAPPLTGSVFTAAWGGRSLSELVGKIRNTMPPNDSGKLTPSQSIDLTAHILQVGKFPPGRTELGSDEGTLKLIVFPASSPEAVAPSASRPLSFPPVGNLTQVMRGILFPSSNIIFNVQTNDPGVPVKTESKAGPDASFSWVNWGGGIYKGWEIVDYAAIAVAESAPLMLTPGRRCENGTPVPVNRPDWIKFSLELAEAGRAAYKASQTRSQDAVSESTNQLADACLHCHEVYRDKRGGTPNDPSNKAARCKP